MRTHITDDFMPVWILSGEQALLEHFSARFAFAFEQRGADDLRLYVARGVTVRLLTNELMHLEKARRN